MRFDTDKTIISVLYNILIKGGEIMAVKNTTVFGGIGVAGMLGVLFVALKLIGIITWSWWWVTCPFWAGTALVIGIMLVIAIVILVCLLIALILSLWK